MSGSKEYYSIEEVQELTGKNRGTVYNRVKLLNIKTHKFPMDRRTYISEADVEKIKKVIEKPWLAQELKADASGDAA